MADIINLRRARKARERLAEKATAAENRARHGRTAADKRRDAIAAERLRGVVDGARREPE